MEKNGTNLHTFIFTFPQHHMALTVMIQTQSCNKFCLWEHTVIFFNTEGLFNTNNYSAYKIYITSEPTVLILLHHVQESEQADGLALTVHLMKQK